MVPLMNPLDERTPETADTIADVARLLYAMPVPAACSAFAGLTAAALIAWQDGCAHEGPVLLERAIAAADRTTRGAGRAFPRLALAGMLTGLGRLDEAERVLDSCQLVVDEELGARWRAAPAIFRSRVQLSAGHVDDAITSARAGIDLARDGGCKFLSIAWLTIAEAALDQDDLSVADAAMARLQDVPPAPRAGVGWATFALVHARIVAARDGTRAAFESLRAIYDDLDAHRSLLLEVPAAAGDLVRLAVKEGDATRAEAVATHATRLADANPDVGSLAAAVAHARGILASDVALLEVAATLQPHAWARASAAEDAGALLLDRRASGSSRGFLERALVDFERAGAVRDTARVRARLRDIGIRRQHGRRQRRPIAGWSSLTDTERRVAEVVAEGLTNREAGGRLFVSRHTVDFHLRQIFRKLAIRSRVELASVVHGQLQDPRDRGM